MDLNFLRARQPDFQYKNRNTNVRAFIPLNLILGPAYAAVQPQTRCCFILNQPNYIAQDY